MDYISKACEKIEELLRQGKMVEAYKIGYNGQNKVAVRIVNYHIANDFYENGEVKE